MPHQQLEISGATKDRSWERVKDSGGAESDLQTARGLGGGGTAVQQPSKTDGQSPEVAGPLSNVAPGPLGAMGSSMNPGPSPLRPACRQNLSNASNWGLQLTWLSVGIRIWVRPLCSARSLERSYLPGFCSVGFQEVTAKPGDGVGTRLSSVWKIQVFQKSSMGQLVWNGQQNYWEKIHLEMEGEKKQFQEEG